MVQDRDDAREGVPDLKRVAASRVSGGGVRLAISLAEPLDARDLLADGDAGGPPGSICARLWHLSAPQTTKPDLLACVTSQADGRTLRATVTREVPGGFPSSVATLRVTRPSRTSLVLRVPGSLFGSARRVAFAGEATRPGCVRLGCVDLAPDNGATKTLRLR